MTGVSFLIHEKVTVQLGGYLHSEDKNGYDGSRIRNSIEEFCEAKTSNFCTSKSAMYIPTRGKSKGQLVPKSRFNGAGVYSDQTNASYSKYMDDNPEVLFSQFLDGRLMYIHSFRFRDIGNYFLEVLKRKQETGLRTNIGFTYLNYIDSKNLQLIYSNPEHITAYEHFFNAKLYDVIKGQLLNGENVSTASCKK